MVDEVLEGRDMVLLVSRSSSSGGSIVTEIGAIDE